MRRAILVVLLLVVVGGLAFFAVQRNAPPEVPFEKARQERIESTLTTNGKVEPVEYAAVRAAREGAVERVAVAKGDTVAAGAVLAEIRTDDARAELAQAEARISEARAALQTLSAGGRPADQTEIQNQAERAKLDLANAQRELATAQRLRARNATTVQEVTDAERRVKELELQLESLTLRRGSLVSQPDRSAAQARLQSAEAAAAAARQRIALGRITTPIAGTVYQMELRPGVYLNPGDLVASVGRLDGLRVILYVDEPELGRVRTGQPVHITWDAQPGRTWEGVVERVPTQITALGSRQVGEVGVLIGNPERTLLPGTNVNAEVKAQVIDNAVTIPRESIRREGDRTGVMVLNGDHVEWRPVQLGASSVTRVQVLQGVKPGDAIALPTERTLNPGDRVTAVLR